MRNLLLLLALVQVMALSACANLPFGPAPESSTGASGSDPSGQANSGTRTGSADAVGELIASSRTSRARGEYAQALAGIERAIRIEPRNPYLWLELGETHLSRDDPRQAAATARRAMSIAGSDSAARAAAEDLLDRATRR